MKDFQDLKNFIIKELHDKCGIKEEDIGLLDRGHIDLVEDCLEFEFGLRNDKELYVFWHSYQDNVGKITKIYTNDNNKEEIYHSWGDWSIYHPED